MNDTGDATITLNRLPGTGGVREAADSELTFQAIGRGTSTVAVTEAGREESADAADPGVGTIDDA